MFLFRRRKVNCSALMTSSLFNEKSFYGAFTKDLKRAEREVIIESPFLTRPRTASVTRTCRKLSKKGVKVRVFTRNPNHHDKQLRIQAWISIKLLREAGVKVKICNDMRHRKLVVIDSRILWEGSMNVLSHKNSREVMRRTVSEQLSKQMLNFTGLNGWRSW